MTMPAGKYYIGDLCYVMHDEWSEVCENIVYNGEFELKDGRRYAMFGTAYGDGTYYDQLGKEYGVDAGLIGCILVSDINTDNEKNRIEWGNVYDITEPFEPYSNGGNMHFGPVYIETDGESDED